MKSDAILIEEILKSREDAFTTLYKRYEQQLFAVAMRYAPSKTLAEDFLQEGFIQIYKKINYCDPEKGAFLPWAKSVLVNVCLRQIQKWKSHTNISEIEEAPVNKFNLDAIDHMSFKEIINLIQKLPEGYRVVFNLYVMDGYSHADIAKETGISVGASKSQLYKAKKYMAKLLEDHYPGIQNMRSYG